MSNVIATPSATARSAPSGHGLTARCFIAAQQYVSCTRVSTRDSIVTRRRRRAQTRHGIVSVVGPRTTHAGQSKSDSTWGGGDLTPSI